MIEFRHVNDCAAPRGIETSNTAMAVFPESAQFVTLKRAVSIRSQSSSGKATSILQ
jgi:hypothetical protein